MIWLKSTVTIWASVKKELLYQRYSHILWKTLIATVFLSFVGVYGLISKAINAYDNYVKAYAFYTEQGVDVKALLQAPASALGGPLTDNQAKYYYDQLSATIYMLNGTHMFTPTLEWLLFVFCPIIFGLYGWYISTYDYKHKTLKLKMLHSSPARILSAKFIASLIVIVFVMTITLVLSAIAGIIASIYLRNKIPVDSFAMIDQLDTSSLLLQLLFALLLCALFTSIGFMLGTIFKVSLLPAILIFAYNLLLPIFGKYDLKNVIASVAHSIFSFKGQFQLVVPVPMSMVTALWTLLLFGLLFVGTSFVLFQKQSKYTN